MAKNAKNNGQKVPDLLGASEPAEPILIPPVVPSLGESQEPGTLEVSQEPNGTSSTPSTTDITTSETAVNQSPTSSDNSQKDASAPSEGKSDASPHSEASEAAPDAPADSVAVSEPSLQDSIAEGKPDGSTPVEATKNSSDGSGTTEGKPGAEPEESETLKNSSDGSGADESLGKQESKSGVSVADGNTDADTSKDASTTQPDSVLISPLPPVSETVKAEKKRKGIAKTIENVIDPLSDERIAELAKERIERRFRNMLEDIVEAAPDYAKLTMSRGEKGLSSDCYVLSNMAKAIAKRIGLSL